LDLYIKDRKEAMSFSKIQGKSKIVTVVPLHKEIKRGTLLGILKLAKISRKDFIKAYKKDC